MSRQRRTQPSRVPDSLVPPAPFAPCPRRPGRPPVHDEAWTKVTVVLFDRQIAYLDRLAVNIRAQSGASLSRAQLIRALVDAAAGADIDLTRATSEADLTTTLLTRLGGYRLGS